MKLSFSKRIKRTDKAILWPHCLCPEGTAADPSAGAPAEETVIFCPRGQFLVHFAMVACIAPLIYGQRDVIYYEVLQFRGCVNAATCPPGPGDGRLGRGRRECKERKVQTEPVLTRDQSSDSILDEVDSFVAYRCAKPLPQSAQGCLQGVETGQEDSTPTPLARGWWCPRAILLGKVFGKNVKCEVRWSRGVRVLQADLLAPSLCDSSGSGHICYGSCHTPLRACVCV